MKTSTTQLMSGEGILTLWINQPSSETFIFIKQSDTKRREWLLCHFGAVRQESVKATKCADTQWRRHNRADEHMYSVCAGACEKQLPPPLREHRKLETIQRLHAGFSSKLFSLLRAGPAPIRPTTYPLGWVFITQGSCSSATQILEFPQEVRFADKMNVKCVMSRLGDIHLCGRVKKTKYKNIMTKVWIWLVNHKWLEMKLWRWFWRRLKHWNLIVNYNGIEKDKYQQLSQNLNNSSDSWFLSHFHTFWVKNEGLQLKVGLSYPTS